MFSVWESAFKEVAALAKKNMTTARSAVEEATGRAMEGAANYANAVSETAAAQSDVAKNSIIVGADMTEDKKNGATGSGKRK
jgi:hypothetical protein